MTGPQSLPPSDRREARTGERELQRAVKVFASDVGLNRKKTKLNITLVAGH
jgi:hypothetical protein